MNNVLVASQNVVKAQATQEALERYGNQTYSVQLHDAEINSGVRQQPLSLEETAKGAVNRLQQIQRSSGYILYVAIEGGAYAVDTPYGKKWYESACAAVADSKGRHTIAYGPAYPIPEPLVRHLEAGKDLNEAMEIETGIVKIGSSQGFNGWLTSGKLDRKEASAQAVLLALYALDHDAGGTSNG